MNFVSAIKILKKTLKEKQPENFSGSWVFREARPVYLYIWKNVRTENGDIDWDKVTSCLDRKFQRRWTRYKRKVVKEYENREEIDLIFSRHKNRLHTLMTPKCPKDARHQEKIIISLVRISQKGNILARQELIIWLTFTVEEWIERRWQIRKWKGYTDDVEDKIECCIRNYKYTGTFLGYLFRTLEYSARGIRPLFKYSLDDPVFEGEESKINYLIHDQQTL
jgi:hypothetical protein